MIAKGNLHGDGGKLAAYLVAGKDGERAELKELRGFVADNIFDAFRDVEIQAEATKCEKPFFHAQVRLPAHETLTPERWQVTADRIEKRLGFKDQPRAIAFHHHADGETHMHVAWSRIDLDRMRAIDPGLYKNKLKELSRELEREFGLTIVRSERDPEQKTRAAGRKEFEQSRRLNTDLAAIRETIRDCWDRSDNGHAFEAALADKGMVLARGDRRDFVIIDAAGGDHALSKRITGATAAETRARMADIDRAHLPSVDQAKAMHLERAPDRGWERGRLDLEETGGRNTGGGEPAPARAPMRDEQEYGPDDATRGPNLAQGLMVAADMIGKPAEKLTDFVAGLAEGLLGGGPAKRKIGTDDYLDNDGARQEYLAQRRAERASNEALDRIRQDIEAGKRLQPEDVRALTPDHILNLKAKGDDYMREIITGHERDAQRSKERERER